MGKFIDMTGWVMKEHGIIDSKITIIDRAPNQGKHTAWNCICECGTKLIIRGDQLKNGVAKSCGCLQKQIAAKNMSIIGKQNKGTISPQRKNYIGQKINKLTLLEPFKKDNSSHLWWKCQCECGNYTEVPSDKLNNGHTQSCGCLHSQTELKMINLLTELGVNYSKEYTFEHLLSDKFHNLRFDFAIFDNNNKLLGLIECQGEQHYNVVNYFGGQEYFDNLVKNDIKKVEYCKNNNIPLLVIRNSIFKEEQIINYIKEISICTDA